MFTERKRTSMQARLTSLLVAAAMLTTNFGGLSAGVAYAADNVAAVMKMEKTEGTVEVSVTDPLTEQVKTETVSTGETALCVVYDARSVGAAADRCDILTDGYVEKDVAGFVLAEVVADDKLSPKLTSVDIPGSVKSIGEYAFWKSGLTSVTIPDGVQSIGYRAFQDCAQLTSVSISDSVINIRNGAFVGCGSLTEINVSAGNSAYSSVDGVVLDKDKKLVICPPGKTSVIIPADVTAIDEYALRDCKGLMTIEVAAGNPNYSSVGGVFTGCESLKEIYFGGTEEEWNALLTTGGINNISPAGIEVKVFYGPPMPSLPEEPSMPAPLSDEGEELSVSENDPESEPTVSDGDAAGNSTVSDGSAPDDSTATEDGATDDSTVSGGDAPGESAASEESASSQPAPRQRTAPESDVPRQPAMPEGGDSETFPDAGGAAEAAIVPRGETARKKPQETL